MVKQIIQAVVEFIAGFEVYIGVRPKSKDADAMKKGEEILADLGIKLD